MSTYREAAKHSVEINQTSPPSPIAINYKWKALARVMYKKQSNPQAYYALWRNVR